MVISSLNPFRSINFGPNYQLNDISASTTVHKEQEDRKQEWLNNSFNTLCSLNKRMAEDRDPEKFSRLIVHGDLESVSPTSETWFHGDLPSSVFLAVPFSRPPVSWSVSFIVLVDPTRIKYIPWKFSRNVFSKKNTKLAKIFYLQWCLVKIVPKFLVRLRLRQVIPTIFHWFTENLDVNNFGAKQKNWHKEKL